MIRNLNLELRNSQTKKPQGFFVWAIGCQQNEFEAARISYMMKSLGFNETTDKEADLIIIVACAVRQTAVDRIFGKLKVWTDKKIILTGCVIEKDKKRFLDRGVSFWDPEKPEDLAKFLNIYDKKKLSALLDEGKKSSSFVPIMTGCNNFCSYCAVPYTRGREKSRAQAEIVADIKKIISNGDFKPRSDIMLLGQNVNSYKPDNEKNGFVNLLETLNNIPGDFVISFISNHPKDMSDEIIDTVSKLPKIKKEIHLPVQSGSDKILKAMNRPYTKKQYLKIIKKIKSADPKIEITTDVIVGFPGETESDFNETVDVFNRVGYKMAYINKYSPRAGTAAYALGDPIPQVEKQRRWHILDKVLKKTMH